MTRQILARALAIGAASALAVAACGSTTPATTPTPAPTTAAATQAAASVAPASAGPGFSFALPSGFNADPELEAMLPAELGGTPVLKFSMGGGSFIGSGQQGTEELAAALAQLGKSPSDLTVAIGTGGTVAVFAWRINGIDATTFYAAFLGMAGQGQGSTVTDASFGGKAVKKVVSDAGETIYLYTKDDVLFGVGGTSVTDDQLNEAFSKLP